jgi:hypothetical protein
MAQGTNVDWKPTARAVIVNTNLTTFQTSIGPVKIAGGLFVFRNVTIPAGTTVRGTGSKPMIFIVTGTFRLDGELSVRGTDGRQVNTLNSANFPAAGGKGNCGGGDGGAGSPSTNSRSAVGATGWGPLMLAGFGGKGGTLSCTNTSVTGSGGGGGAFATAGDPWFKVKAGTGNVFVQQLGQGGFGRTGTIRTVPGGAPGLVYFRDNNPGNNFFGLGADINRRMLITGELPLLVGGSGGGGGGDYSLGGCTLNNPNFINDDKGGGGGGGGGVLGIVCDGNIVLGPKARINADGGNGGGGAWAGSNRRGGGGGGGAGGLVALFTRKQIDIQVHGETYANNDFDFAISAEGGVGLAAAFVGPRVNGKYTQTPSAQTLDGTAAGGFGGMGIIQLMVPWGTNQDNTNTFLDDNIVLRSGTTVLTGAQKQRYLAWRGFPDAQGVWRDDFGKATNIRDSAGDFRPTPILLPAF